MSLFLIFRSDILGNLSSCRSQSDLLKRILILEQQLYKANDQITALSEQIKALKEKCKEKDGKIMHLEEENSRLHQNSNLLTVGEFILGP